MTKNEPLSKPRETLNKTLHGYKLNKPCKLPFRIYPHKKLFYDCVWTKRYESTGLWSYSDIAPLTQTSHDGNERSICSEDCSVENSPLSCISNNSYTTKQSRFCFENCNRREDNAQCAIVKCTTIKIKGKDKW